MPKLWNETIGAHRRAVRDATLDTTAALAAEHGLAVFGEHTADARNRPGAHPNVDRLLAIVAGGEALSIEEVAA